MYYIANNRMFKTAKYNQWIGRTVPLVRLHFRGRFLKARQPAVVKIRANLNRKRDLDNILKPIVDCLQHANIIPNDNYVDYIEMIRDTSVSLHHFTLEVSKYECSGV